MSLWLLRAVGYPVLLFPNVDVTTSYWQVLPVQTEWEQSYYCSKQNAANQVIAISNLNYGHAIMIKLLQFENWRIITWASVIILGVGVATVSALLAHCSSGTLSCIK